MINKIFSMFWFRTWFWMKLFELKHEMWKREEKNKCLICRMNNEYNWIYQRFKVIHYYRVIILKLKSLENILPYLLFACALIIHIAH